MSLPAIEAPADAPIVDLMRAAVEEADPDAVAVPMMITLGTDAKALARIGIPTYGFVPLSSTPAPRSSTSSTATTNGSAERHPLRRPGSQRGRSTVRCRRSGVAARRGPTAILAAVNETDARIERETPRNDVHI